MPDPLAGSTLDVQQRYLQNEQAPKSSERLCQETLRNGEQCHLAALEDSLFCARHHVIVSKAAPTRDVLRYREQLLDNAKLELLRMSPKALTTVEQVMDNEAAPAQVRLKAATEVLDRIGVRGGMEIDVSAEIHTDPAEDIRRRLDAMGEGILSAITAHQSAQIVEGEVTDEPSSSTSSDPGSGSDSGGDQSSNSSMPSAL